MAASAAIVIEAVLFDRDGTLVADSPGNRDPDLVQLMPGAHEAVSMLRARGYAVGVVTNQPAGASRPTEGDALARMHRRLSHLLGIDAWFVCRHAEGEGCGCRKPRPGLIFAAAEHFRVSTAQCVMIGDIGSDMEAAKSAGARAILVPTVVTLPAEISDAPTLAASLVEAARRIVEDAL